MYVKWSFSKSKGMCFVLKKQKKCMLIEKPGCFHRSVNGTDTPSAPHPVGFRWPRCTIVVLLLYYRCTIENIRTIVQR